MFLSKDKVNATEILISRNLICSYIRHDVLVNNVLKEYEYMKEATKKSHKFWFR